jgi:hypothetical protein
MTDPSIRDMTAARLEQINTSRRLLPVVRTPAEKRAALDSARARRHDRLTPPEPEVQPDPTD